MTHGVFQSNILCKMIFKSIYKHYPLYQLGSDEIHKKVLLCITRYKEIFYQNKPRKNEKIFEGLVFTIIELVEDLRS